MNAPVRTESPLVQAVRDLLRDCPQGIPQPSAYESAGALGEAMALWKVRQRLEAALLIETGAIQ